MFQLSLLTVIHFCGSQRNPPSKKAAPAKAKAPEPKADALGWHLGNNRFANVKEFRGKIMVNIREYYEKDGEMLPGKKGMEIFICFLLW